ncbi:MAG: NAD(P)H-dependent oxidoreductase [Spirochaetaceae bacterium]
MNKLIKRILVIGGSSSRRSINAELARYTGKKLQNVSTKELKIIDFELPLYSVDKESEDGIPQKALDFVHMIEESDGIIISLAEHNGSYTAAFKNILDWASTSKRKLWDNKPMFLLSTAPGHRGGEAVFNQAKSYFPHMGGNIVASFILPRFNNNFTIADGVYDEELKIVYEHELNKYQKALELLT